MRSISSLGPIIGDDSVFPSIATKERSDVFV